VDRGWLAPLAARPGAPRAAGADGAAGAQMHAVALRSGRTACVRVRRSAERRCVSREQRRAGGGATPGRRRLMPPGRRREAQPSRVEDGGKVRVALWRGSGAAPGAGVRGGPRGAAERAWEPVGTAQREWAGVVGEAALAPPEACEETSQDRAEEGAGHAGDEQPGPSLARAVRELGAGAPPCTAADAAEAAEALEAALLLLYQGDRALVRAAAWSRRGPALSRARPARGVARARPPHARRGGRLASVALPRPRRWSSGQRFWRWGRSCGLPAPRRPTVPCLARLWVRAGSRAGRAQASGVWQSSFNEKLELAGGGRRTARTEHGAPRTETGPSTLTVGWLGTGTRRAAGNSWFALGEPGRALECYERGFGIIKWEHVRLPSHPPLSDPTCASVPEGIALNRWAASQGDGKTEVEQARARGPRTYRITPFHTPQRPRIPSISKPARQSTYQAPR
jgi:hypothetical protein